jgi:hypothetical protein
MPEDDFLKCGSCVRQIAGKLRGMFRPNIKREPVGVWISVLPLELRNIYGASVNPRRRPCLESFDRKPKLVNLLSDLGGRCFSRPARRNLRLKPHVNPAAQKRAYSQDNRARPERASIQRLYTIDASAGHQ